MKILFLSRVDLFNPRGGDTTQMEKTKKFIEKLDNSIQIDISTEVYPKNINSYDIVHVFNLDWVAETYPQIKYAKEAGKKIVLSAIHHDEAEVKKYEQIARYDIRRLYNAIFTSQSMRDTWKNVYRSIYNHQKISPTLLQLSMGIRKQQKLAVELSDVVLVQTEEEAKSITKDFGVQNFKFEKVVNGVDSEVFLNANANEFNDLFANTYKEDISAKKILLNVGRIEPRKNQLILIDIFRELQKENKTDGAKLIFIGELSNKSYEYIYRFKKLIKDTKDVYWFPGLSQSLVASAMRHVGVYVHPSWFETTGLVCLEAIVSGMPVVTSSTRLREYIEKGITYCDPSDRQCIKDAILKSVSEKADLTESIDNIKKNYTWEVAASQTINVYKSLLNI